MFTYLACYVWNVIYNLFVRLTQFMDQKKKVESELSMNVKTKSIFLSTNVKTKNIFKCHNCLSFATCQKYK